MSSINGNQIKINFVKRTYYDNGGKYYVCNDLDEHLDGEKGNVQDVQYGFDICLELYPSGEPNFTLVAGSHTNKMSFTSGVTDKLYLVNQIIISSDELILGANNDYSNSTYSRRYFKGLSAIKKEIDVLNKTNKLQIEYPKIKDDQIWKLKKINKASIDYDLNVDKEIVKLFDSYRILDGWVREMIEAISQCDQKEYPNLDLRDKIMKNDKVKNTIEFIKGVIQKKM